MTEKTLETLFHDTLKDIYFAEHEITKALPKMAKAAQSRELRSAFEKHLKETKGQIDRLDKVFAIIGKKPQAKTCEAIKGILKEGAEVMEELADEPACDAGLAAAAQAVEHYEMARYGALRTWAGELGMKDAAALLQETLTEEEATDEALTQLAEASLNPAAMQGAGKEKPAARRSA